MPLVKITVGNQSLTLAVSDEGLRIVNDHVVDPGNQNEFGPPGEASPQVSEQLPRWILRSQQEELDGWGDDHESDDNDDGDGGDDSDDSDDSDDGLEVWANEDGWGEDDEGIGHSGVRVYTDSDSFEDYDVETSSAAMNRNNSRLPPELWAEIFTTAIDYRTRSQDDCILEQYRCLVAISQTCQTWRLVALHFKSWWGQLLPIQHVSCEWLQVLLSRSGTSPLCVISGIPSISSQNYLRRIQVIRANWQLVFEHSRRFKHVFIRTGRIPFWNPPDFDEMLNGEMPVLESFTFLQDADQLHGSISPDTLFHAHAPALKALQLRGAWPLAFVLDPTAPLQGLTHLYLHHHSRQLGEDEQAAFTAGMWVEMFRRMPNLVSVTLISVVFEDEEDWPLPLGPSYQDDPVALTSLGFFHLVAYSHPASCLLSALTIPADCHVWLIQVADEDTNQVSYARDLDLISSCLASRAIIADSWYLGTKDNFVLSARSGRKSTFHFETVWTSAQRHRDDFDEVMEVFINFLDRFRAFHSVALSQARLLGLKLDRHDNPFASTIGHFLCYFPRVETLFLYSVHPLNLGAISGHYHADMGARGHRVLHILPQLRSIHLDAALVLDRARSGPYNLVLSLMTRSSQPVSRIETIGFLIQPPHPLTQPSPRRIGLRRDINPLFCDLIREVVHPPTLARMSNDHMKLYMEMVSNTIQVDHSEAVGEDITTTQFDNTHIWAP